MNANVDPNPNPDSKTLTSYYSFPRLNIRTLANLHIRILPAAEATSRAGLKFFNGKAVEINPVEVQTAVGNSGKQQL